MSKEKIYTEGQVNEIVYHLFKTLIENSPNKTTKEYLEFNRDNLIEYQKTLEGIRNGTIKAI